MVRFSLLKMLVMFSLVPVGIGFVWGSEMNATVALIWIFPSEFSGKQVVTVGWPMNATDFLAPYFENLSYPVEIVHSIGCLFVVAICAALGTLRLELSKLSAWSLIAVLPISVGLWNLQTGGQLYVLPHDYVLAVIYALLCLVAWWIAQRITNRWIYKGKEPQGSSIQKLLFAVLAVVIIVTSMSGWLWLQRMQAYMSEHPM